MSLRRSQIRLLYLQIRQDSLTRAEEFQEFVVYSGLDPSQFTVLNVFDTPTFQPACVDNYDALFVGGSSDASVLNPQRYPFVQSAKELMVYCERQGIPVFASCFGFQLAVEALDGKVIADPDQMEMGVYPMQLTAIAQNDLLLHDLPNPFLAISGHKERALTLPPLASCLASTERCPYHAFRMGDKPFYGFQFHPELNPQDLTVRIQRYKAHYLEDDAHLEQVLATLRETPESNQLIAKFVDRILLAS
ncbi:MAG: type 1 glutamine amidotransferase [Thermosynechococcaceae cyanobacterium MS004]|nr:type 1 glutamine amidotransferase [Thermosynechococcaceae cyanobacterium MS004]